MFLALTQQIHHFIVNAVTGVMVDLT